MENSYTKYLELVEEGKILPNGELKPFLGEISNVNFADSFKAMKEFGLVHEVLMESINYTKRHPNAHNAEILDHAFRKYDLL